MHALKVIRARPLEAIVVAATFLFACGLAYEPLYHILRGSLAYSLIPQDDFYYYYLPAKNLALHGISSFDGIVPTNGYHPLWMWVLTGLAYIAQGNDRTCFVLIEVVQVASAVITSVLVLRLFRLLYPEQKWSATLALLVSLLLTVLIFLGMETVVVIPAYLCYGIALYRMLATTEEKHAVISGIAACIMVLARLDTLLMVVLSVAVMVIQMRVGLKRTAYYLLGFAPIALYFLYNRLVFETWWPVSAEAKQLPSGLHISFRAIETIATPRGALYVALTMIGLILVLSRLRRDAIGAVKFLLLAFPIAFAVVLAFRLSWSPYVWYFYPYPISAALGLLEMRGCLRSKLAALVDRIAAPGLIVILVAAGVLLYRDIEGLTSKLNLVESETRAQPNIYIHALGIKPFTDSHPGRYAMGDRAGLTAFITGKPFLQLEGLAADKALVDSIACEADLLNVLREYGVHYYVVSYPLREFHEKDGHWLLFEPHKQQVQPWAPVMTGHFYAPEVFRFPAPVGATISAQDSARLWVTRILDISRATEDTVEGKQH